MATTTRPETPMCSICLEFPNNPLRIPCLHVFCLNCLQQLIGRSRGGVFECPNCRYQHDIPEMGVEAFPVAFEPRKEHAPGRSVFSTPCPLHHTKKLRVFCLCCEESICVQCKSTMHKGHPTANLMELLRDRRTYLQWSSADINNKVGELSSISNSLKKKFKMSAACKSKDVAKVEKHAKCMKDMIDGLSMELIKNIESDYDEIQRPIERKLRTIETRKEEVKEFASTADRIIADNDADGLLFDFKRLIELEEKIMECEISGDVDNMRGIFERGVCNRTDLQSMLGRIRVTPSQEIVTNNDVTDRIVQVCPDLRPSTRHPVLPDIRPRPRVCNRTDLQSMLGRIRVTPSQEIVTNNDVTDRNVQVCPDLRPSTRHPVLPDIRPRPRSEDNRHAAVVRSGNLPSNHGWIK